MPVRTSLLAFGAASAAAAIVLFGCSNASQSGSLGLLPTTHQAQPGHVLGLLYVADLFPTNQVNVLQNKTWTQLDTITNGVHGPSGTWVDRNKNLYVANNYYGGNITEYNSSGTLIFTYSSGIINAFAVTTDRFGNVYEGDGIRGGKVIEYGQGSNSPIATCVPSGAVAGIAVDKNGDVFVDSYTSMGGGSIMEYVGGLTTSGCTGTNLAVSIKGAGGIAIDKGGDLVAAEGVGAAVAIIAPPYTSVTGTLGSGWTNPSAVTIGDSGTQAYVTDPGFNYGSPTNAVVKILTYPGGSTVATLGNAQGLQDPQSAVDSRNYVP